MQAKPTAWAKHRLAGQGHQYSDLFFPRPRSLALPHDSGLTMKRMTALYRIDHSERTLGDRFQFAASLLPVWKGLEELPRVRMKGVGKESVAIRHLDNLTGIHNGNTIRNFINNPEIVGNE